MVTKSYAQLNVGTASYAYTKEDCVEKEFIQRQKRAFIELDTTQVIGCFSWYFTYANKTDYDYKFLFGFTLLPGWFLDFVEEFNSQFKNIQIEVIHTVPLHVDDVDDSSKRFVTTNITTKKPANAMSAGFVINFSTEYPKFARKIAMYVVHHIVRQLSFLEYTWQSAKHMWLSEPPYLKAIVFRSNNTPEKYRALAERRITVQHLLNLDNIERANKIEDTFKKLKEAGISINLKQTAILGLFTKQMCFCRCKEWQVGRKFNVLSTPDIRMIPTKRPVEIILNRLNGWYTNDDGETYHNGYIYLHYTDGLLPSWTTVGNSTLLSMIKNYEEKVAQEEALNKVKRTIELAKVKTTKKVSTTKKTTTRKTHVNTIKKS
jgi:hypothetical protein